MIIQNQAANLFNICILMIASYYNKFFFVNIIYKADKFIVCIQLELLKVFSLK